MPFLFHIICDCSNNGHTVKLANCRKIVFKWIFLIIFVVFGSERNLNLPWSPHKSSKIVFNIAFHRVYVRYMRFVHLLPKCLHLEQECAKFKKYHIFSYILEGLKLPHFNRKCLVLHLSEDILVFDTVSKIPVCNSVHLLPHFHSALHVGNMQNNKKTNFTTST